MHVHVHVLHHGIMIPEPIQRKHSGLRNQLRMSSSNSTYEKVCHTQLRKEVLRISQVSIDKENILKKLDIHQ